MTLTQFNFNLNDLFNYSLRKGRYLYSTEYTENYEDGFEESNNAILKEITVLISKSQSETLDFGTRPIVYTDGSCLNQGI